MKLNNEDLLSYYLSLREPEAGGWNLSPQSLYLELESRDFLLRNVPLFDGMKVCNIGIGTGEWDDYLGYLLLGKGKLTSVDIDPEICQIFTYRQQREGHPNPSAVRCENILESTLAEEHFDLVTMIGSTLNEIGTYHAALEKCFQLLKPNGKLVYMDFQKYHSSQTFLEWVDHCGYKINCEEHFDRYKNVSSYMFLIQK